MMSSVILYAAQRPIVRDILMQDGIYHVKQRFIDQKYGESSWIFNTAYSFFKDKASLILPRPKEAEGAIWLYCHPAITTESDDAVPLTLSIPEDKVIFFDNRLWHRILNLKYIGENERDTREFESRLSAMGLDGNKIFSSSFYPNEKQQILKSWERLFDSADCELCYRQAAAWELRKEWLI